MNDLVSECCGYPPVNNMDADNFGRCSLCKEGSHFRIEDEDDAIEPEYEITKSHMNDR